MGKIIINIDIHLIRKIINDIFEEATSKIYKISQLITYYYNLG